MGRLRRVRADAILVDRGFFETRSQAREAILQGKIKVGGKALLKPGTLVGEGSQIELVEAAPYVSRGGLKLAKALKDFQVSVQDKTVLDVGASTGGFTDCLLKAGAAKVIAVDVGYGQIALSLRNDPRVTLLERTNIRYLAPETLGCQPELATVDVSFISLKLVSINIARLLSLGGEGIFLVKPQFEASRQSAKRGVVREPHVHRQVLTGLVSHFENTGWRWSGVTYAPIKGPKGNIEFFLHFLLPRKGARASPVPAVGGREMEGVVDEAHRVLSSKEAK